jgi:acetolactate synthase-1/2/3 large subunit
MKTVAEAVADFFQDYVDTVFVVSGGAALHLIHAFGRNDKVSCIPLNHEQSCVMAADGYARRRNSLGLCISTSGPGATNLLTGLAGAFYDSIPLICLTGQVSRQRMLKTPSLRQYGFQQTPIQQMAEPISKASILVTNPDEIRYKLEEAVWIALEGRKGPVLIDIPDDVQREVIDWSRLSGYSNFRAKESQLLDGEILRIRNAIRESSRPVVIAGAGLCASSKQEFITKSFDQMPIPTVFTWGASKYLDRSNPFHIGFFGTHGERQANLVVQNADLILSLGCRLDTKATGSPATTFARSAKKIVVEIDISELQKFEELAINIDFPVTSDVGTFLERLNLEEAAVVISREWIDYCEQVREALGEESKFSEPAPGINPYLFFRELAKSSPSNLSVFLDTGTALPYALSSFPAKKDHRIFHDFNHTAMGWSIPASIGGSLAAEGEVLTVVGDGSLMMALSDLVSLAGMRNRSKVVLLDNSGHSMIRQTQDQWLSGEYIASSIEGGLSFPNFRLLAESCGFEYLFISERFSEEDLHAFWEAKNPIFLHLSINNRWRVSPQVTFGYPNEDQDPPMPDELFKKFMIVEPLEVSKIRHNLG